MYTGNETLYWQNTWFKAQAVHGGLYTLTA